MKQLRNGPMAIAAAALIAAPTALAEPVDLTRPQETSSSDPNAGQSTNGVSATAAIPPATPYNPALPENLSLQTTPAPAPVVVAAPAPVVAPPAAPPPVPPPAPAAVAAAVAAPRQSPAPTATVSVAQRDEYTRLVFRFAGPTTVVPAAQGERLELRFSRGADMDIAELRSAPPRFVRDVRRLSTPGAPVRLALTLEPGTRQRHFVDGDRVVVDLLPPDATTQAAQTAAQAAAHRAPSQTAQTPQAAAQAVQPPQPPSVTGNATVRLVEEASLTRITVTWPGPARAAAFRRGEAVWLMFDASGQISLSGVARAGRRHQDIEIVRGENIIGLRIPAPPDVLVSANSHGSEWEFTLGARAERTAEATLRRDASTDGHGRLVAAFGRQGVVRWINDPEIGDRIAVAMLSGGAIGVGARRATLEATLLPAAQGAVVEPRADDVTVGFSGGDLIVARQSGLMTTAAIEPANMPIAEGALEQLGPDTQEAALSQRSIRDRLDDLMRRAADEGTREGAPVTARMALARFLLENELAAEALGALRVVAVNQGELVDIDPEFRLMRGAANVMMNRPDAARADLSASALANDPSAALWRGYAAAQKQDWVEARRELERGVGALEQHSPAWRARFQMARAEAAFELNDFAAADGAAQEVLGQATGAQIRLRAQLLKARIEAARADPTRALQMLDELSHVRDEEIAVRANLEAVRLRRSIGRMRAIDCVETLEALRFRWRGDALELAIISELGDVYSELGRWRDALTAMRSTVDRFPGDAAARRVRQDMATLFERLYLDGEADHLEPIQALGLFYEFSDLTPVGPNGDRMVRLLAGRLVHVDLLEQAAQLLQHQVDERLQGIGKAQVAADLAAIYLMDAKPDRALVAINMSRQPNLPNSLLMERRIIEARALLGLGRLDHAVELVERDRSEDAQRVRAEAAWRARDWERAAAELRTLLALRDRAAPLDAGGRQIVLRTGIALTLAGNDAGVAALYREFAGDMAGTDDADSFEVIASGIQADGAAIRDLARVVARTDLLSRFMDRVRARMTADAVAADAARPAMPGSPAPGAPTPPASGAAPPPTTPRPQAAAPAA
jgi:tetratricopeptide (TPR) repeat protein